MTLRWTFLLTAAALLVFAAPSHAQTSLYISGGATFPTSDYGDYANTGWMAAGGVMFGVGPSGLSVGADLFYGQNNHKDELSLFEGEKTSQYGAMGVLLYAFDTAGVQPYVFGGLGALVHRFSADNIDSESDTQFGYQLGAGVGFPIGASSQIYAEGRYVGSEDTKYFALLGGFAFWL